LPSTQSTVSGQLALDFPVMSLDHDSGLVPATGIYTETVDLPQPPVVSPGVVEVGEKSPEEAHDDLMTWCASGPDPLLQCDEDEDDLEN